VAARERSEPRRYGLGSILLTIAIVTALGAMLGVIVAHIGH
jgi:H+/gluconate symporter-like permease